MKMRLRFLLMLIGLLATLPVVQAAPAQQTNLLQNPGFEQPFSSGTADKWQRWSRDDPANAKDAACLNGYHFRPKWNVETNGSLVHGGSASQYIGNNWDTWQGGVHQTVAVTPGSTYRFSFFARVRGSNETSPAPSEGGLQANVRAGIDPNGSGNWADSDVVWGGAGSPHDTWQQFSVEVVAATDRVTVFTAADWGIQGVNQCRQFLDTWHDSAQLVVALPPPTNTPVPLPTNPPLPTATLTPEPTATMEASPTATIVPTATAVPTDTPIPGGIVCVNAFADENANGIRDEVEGYIAGITLQVGSLETIVGQAVSTGTADSVCFEGVLPGSYQVSQLVPANLQMTTAPNTTIEVEAGKTYGIEFGSRFVPAGISSDDTISSTTVASNVTVPTLAPEVVEPPADAGFSLAAYAGLFVLLLAVIGVGVLIFIALRRQAS
jgi:hypothetical protein